MAERRARGAEEAAAEAANYGKTEISTQLLERLCKVKFQALPVEAIATVHGFLVEKGLSTVTDVVGHHGRLYDRVRDYLDDQEMGFRKLCQVLASTNKLAEHLPAINSQLFVGVPGTSRDELKASTLRQALDVCATVCEQYKAEEKDRNSSNYDRALETLEGAKQLSLVVRARWRARGELYKDEEVLHSCVCLRGFNETFLGASFDKTLHLPAGAQDLSFGDYTPHLAAKPGADSRLALSKIGDVPTRRPQLISNLIIRVDGVVEAPPRCRRRATPSTHSFRAGT